MFLNPLPTAYLDEKYTNTWALKVGTQGQSDSTAGRLFDLHMADPDSIPGIPARSDS